MYTQVHAAKTIQPSSETFIYIQVYAIQYKVCLQHTIYWQSEQQIIYIQVYATKVVYNTICKPILNSTSYTFESMTRSLYTPKSVQQSLYIYKVCTTKSMKYKVCIQQSLYIYMYIYYISESTAQSLYNKAHTSKSTAQSLCNNTYTKQSMPHLYKLYFKNTWLYYILHPTHHTVYIGRAARLCQQNVR